MKGNQLAMKLDTPELRLLAYKSYCDHIAQGYPNRAWCMEKPVTLTWATIERYIRDYPDELDPVHKEVAKAKSYKKWFNIVADGATGRGTAGSPAYIQIMMRNMFGWDRVSNEASDDISAVLWNQERVLTQIKSLQLQAQRQLPSVPQNLEEVDISTSDSEEDRS